jgi:hypothetical protein
MVELNAIELVDTELTNDIIYTKNNHPANVRIMRLKKDKFEWFLSEEFKQLRDNFTPVDNRKFMQEPDPEKEATKAAAATEGVTKTTSPPVDDETKANQVKRKTYADSQAKIRADAAKMKRGSNKKNKASSSNNNKRSKRK